LSLSEEEFRYLYERSCKLSRIADKALKLRRRGLPVTEFEELVGDLKDELRRLYGRLCTAGEELYIVELLDWSVEFVKALERRAKESALRLMLALFPRLRALLDSLEKGELPPLPKLREVLPKLPPPGPGRRVLRGVMEFLDIPPPPSPNPGQVLEEVERTVDLLLADLENNSRLLEAFFNEITPESIPWVVELFRRNPGEARSTLGEPLSVWWLRMVLGQREHPWAGTYGPIKSRIEIDAISPNGAIAEIKNAKPGSEEYYEACEQLAERVCEIVRDPNILKPIIPRAAEGFKLEEAAVVTLYRLKGYKEGVEEALVKSFQKRNIGGVSAKVYDGDDMLRGLDMWSPKEARERYTKLFKSLIEILDKTAT
jgi:hypothetical protein